ncbi:hypothetical protein COO60DRAFT_1480481 [Scenedesmus sp. NREL 46B-D3]|nr:hypothetical protein COO60DRAFT_1480481 [Scenedesmus sp. NREL 46B-D3]
MNKVQAVMCVLALLSAAHNAVAVRQLSEAVATPAEQGKQLIPFKDAEGTWQPANITGLDFDSLTLLDLPSPEIFLEVAMTSPYAMPDIPMQTLVDNTVKAWAGGKPPSNVNDWLLLLQNGGNFITSNLPTFLVKLLPNITLADGKQLSIGAEAGKVVTALAPLLGSNTTVELPLPGDMAAGVGVSRPTVNVDLIQGINVTLEVVRRLPTLLKQVSDNVREGVRTSIENLQLPEMGEITNDDGTLDVPALIKSALNIEVSAPVLPPAPDASQVLLGVTRALPIVAGQLGLNTTNMRLPDPEVVAAVLKKANGNQLFVTDKRGRVDLLATLMQLPEKVPQVQKVVAAVAAPPQGWPEVGDVAKMLVKAAGQRLAAQAA